MGEKNRMVIFLLKPQKGYRLKKFHGWEIIKLPRGFFWEKKLGRKKG